MASAFMNISDRKHNRNNLLFHSRVFCRTEVLKLAIMRVINIEFRSQCNLHLWNRAVMAILI